MRQAPKVRAVRRRKHTAHMRQGQALTLGSAWKLPGLAAPLPSGWHAWSHACGTHVLHLTQAATRRCMRPAQSCARPARHINGVREPLEALLLCYSSCTNGFSAYQILSHLILNHQVCTWPSTSTGWGSAVSAAHPACTHPTRSVLFRMRLTEVNECEVGSHISGLQAPGLGITQTVQHYAHQQSHRHRTSTTSNPATTTHEATTAHTNRRVKWKSASPECVSSQTHQHSRCRRLAVLQGAPGCSARVMKATLLPPFPRLHWYCSQAKRCEPGLRTGKLPRGTPKPGH